MGPMVEIEREKVPRRRHLERRRQSPGLLRRARQDLGCIPLFSLLRQESLPLLFVPPYGGTDPGYLCYARLPSKYLPFACPDESWLAVTRFRARAWLVQPRIVIASSSSEGKTSGIQRVSPSPSPFFLSFSFFPCMEARASSSSSCSARLTYDQKKRD